MGKRKWITVVGLRAKHPKMHWSKLVMPTAAIVLRRRIGRLVQTLDGSRLRAHKGYCGCSIKAQPPTSTSVRKTSKIKRIRRDPTITCRHAFKGMLGIPSGHVPERTGGGPPSSKRAVPNIVEPLIRLFNLLRQPGNRLLGNLPWDPCILETLLEGQH